MSENILRIAKGETLCTYELTRLSPFQHGPLPAGVPATGEHTPSRQTCPSTSRHSTGSH